MRYLKTSLFLLATFQIISWTALSQPSIQDSTRRISVVRWQVERLVQDAYKLRALEAYVSKLEQEAAVSDKLISRQDSSMRVKDQIIASYSMINIDWKGRFENQKELTKQERRQKRRWRLAAIMVGLVWVAVQG